MKKTIIVLVALILSSIVYANEAKTYITIAYNYGSTTERAELNGVKTQTELISNGLDLSVSYYGVKNWGFYLNTDYNFPTKATVTTKGISVTVTDSDWDSSMLLSVILGPTYKYDISPKFELFGAAGFHLAQYSMATEYVGTINYSFGIGGDIGVRFLPSNHFYLTAGSILSHDFYYKGEIRTAYNTTKNDGSYDFTSFRPYLGIGFTFSEIIK